MKNVLDIFKERGFLKQVVYEEELYEKLGKESVTFYIGFDPTADSLHIGHFVQMMAIRHMLNCGHKAILLIGGGTTMIGDPTDKTQMRTLLDKESIIFNGLRFINQMGKYIDLSNPNVTVDNNARWLLDLNYIDFLREVGAHFSVNKMLTAECYKARMEKGLTFLEFNYMLMQSYDFLMLNRLYNCELQLGGNDQWSNILAGADLIRRKEQKPAYAMTFTLLETKEGKKMGKTSSGAIWLDEEKTPPYDFYQYWRNVEDEKVEECFKILTFLELDEIAAIMAGDIISAKKRLAYEITRIIHGDAKAKLAEKQAEGAFGGNVEDMPAVLLTDCKTIVDYLIASKFAPSKGEARRLIEGGGVSVNDTKITDAYYSLSPEIIDKGEFILHKGKKNHIRVLIK